MFDLKKLLCHGMLKQCKVSLLNHTALPLFVGEYGGIVMPAILTRAGTAALGGWMMNSL